jgi:hypothetical protein
LLFVKVIVALKIAKSRLEGRGGGSGQFPRKIIRFNDSFMSVVLGGFFQG